MFLLNPAFLFAILWTFIGALYAMHLSNLLEPLKASTVVLVIGSSLALIGGWLIESLLRVGSKFATPKVDIGILASSLNSTRVKRRLKIAAVVFVFLLAGEVTYAGGMPLLGDIGIGKTINYAHFGIPGLHGLVNAIYYSICSIQFVRILLLPNQSSVSGFVLISMLYPILGMSRQVLMSLIIQYVMIYIFIRRPSAKQLLIVALMFFLVLLFFGYLGDIRSGRDHILERAATDFEYPDWMPSAFIWVYLYLCTPLNNVNNNIDLVPNYFPVETASTLFPSFIRQYSVDALGLESSIQWELVTESFNVNSLLQTLLVDFGIVGTIYFMFVLGVLFSVVLRQANRTPASFLATIVFLHGIALSFFANLLFHLVFISQIIIVRIILGRQQTSKGLRCQ